MNTITIIPDEKAIAEVLNFVEKHLSKAGCTKKEIAEGMLLSEECFIHLIQYTNEPILLKISKFLGKITLKCETAGAPMDINKVYEETALKDYDGMDIKTEFAIRSILLKHFSDRIKLSYKANTNYLSIVLKENSYLQTKLTMIGLLAGVIGGFTLKSCVPQAGTILNSYLFSPVSSIFINCMKCLVGPIVFLCILNSIIGFDDLKVLGKIGTKMMGMYVITSIIAIGLGYAGFKIFDPGVFNSLVLSQSSAETVMVNTNFADTIVNFFSSNVIVSFFNNDTIQIILVALFCGIALNMMGERNKPVKELIGALNEMVSIIASIITNVSPFVVFCSIASIFISVDLASLLSLVYMAFTIIITLFVMVCIYGLLILVLTHLNPLVLFKKYLKTFLMVFSLTSSNAAIPLNMKFASDIGISKKLSSFSIPLGATINMDGLCINYVIATLFIAKVYGCTFTTTGLIQLLFLIFVISIGTPGISGTITTMMIPMVAICGLPANATLLIMGIDTIIDMFRTSVNTLGDQSATLIVAAREGLLDKEKYYNG